MQRYGVERYRDTHLHANMRSSSRRGSISCRNAGNWRETEIDGREAPT